MNITEATQSARERSNQRNPVRVAVVKAEKGEVYKGFYPEYFTEAIPPHQLVAVYFKGEAE